MSKKIQLTIAEPCHENWDGMTPVEKGKFCGSCQKQVVDFSNLSDRQVAEFFKKPSTGSVCGRFMTDQLDRAIEIPRKRIPWMKYFFQIAIPAFLVSIKVSASKTQQRQPQVKTVTKDTTKIPPYNELRTMGIVARPEIIKPVKVDTIVAPVKEPIQMVKGEIAVKTPTKEPVCNREIMGTVTMPVEINKNEIEGTVVDENNQPVPFASIETGKAGEGLMTDANGYFKIRKNWFSKGKTLTFSSVGFENKTIIAGEAQYSAGRLFVQLKANVVLPEVVLNPTSNVLMGKIAIGGVGIRKITKEELIIEKKDTAAAREIKLPVEENSLLVYPNPIQSGATLNLSFKKIDEGYYQFQILNQSGQMVQQKEIWVDAEARLLNTEVPVVAAGSYFMVLTNKKTGKKFTEKIIIQ